MAKCRNCKKEIDANATRCPYCLTEMPTSDFIAKFKGAIIALILIGVFALAMYFFIINIGDSIHSLFKDINNGWALIIDVFLWFIAFILLPKKTTNKKARNIYVIIGTISLLSSLILTFFMIWS